MYNDYTNLDKNEKIELNNFKVIFSDGILVKKKCITFGWVERTIRLSKDNYHIEWDSEDKSFFNFNPDIHFIKNFSICDIKNIYRDEKDYKNLLTNTIHIIIDKYSNNYIYEKKITYKFDDHFLSNIFFNGLILLKKEINYYNYLNINIPRSLYHKYQNNNNNNNHIVN